MGSRYLRRSAGKGRKDAETWHDMCALSLPHFQPFSRYNSKVLADEKEYGAPGDEFQPIDHPGDQRNALESWNSGKFIN